MQQQDSVLNKKYIIGAARALFAFVFLFEGISQIFINSNGYAMALNDKMHNINADLHYHGFAFLSPLHYDCMRGVTKWYGDDKPSLYLIAVVLNYLYGWTVLVAGIAQFFFEDNGDQRLSYFSQRRRTLSLQVLFIAYFCNLFMHFPWTDTGKYREKEILICLLNLIMMAGILMMVAHKSNNDDRQHRKRR
ncbi:hypothetical protein FGO68_gene3779 [Halteria grandinella]|uniref:Uncharacterized protein n=1 Tax=Halteria grandinella TaxID=5974 RepID=A0A8J8SYY9_HALGN|nr:hypothetical protein FGO68_gene3779 [Halteria grandinella]